MKKHKNYNDYATAIKFFSMQVTKETDIKIAEVIMISDTKDHNHLTAKIYTNKGIFVFENEYSFIQQLIDSHSYSNLQSVLKKVFVLNN